MPVPFLLTDTSGGDGEVIAFCTRLVILGLSACNLSGTCRVLDGVLDGVAKFG